MLRRVIEALIEDEGGSDVVVDVDPELEVIVDPLVIERVVSNLLANARSHGRPPIRISAESATAISGSPWKTRATASRRRSGRVCSNVSNAAPPAKEPGSDWRSRRHTRLRTAATCSLVRSERGARFELTLPLG